MDPKLAVRVGRTAITARIPEILKDRRLAFGCIVNC